MVKRWGVVLATMGLCMAALVPPAAWAEQSIARSWGRWHDADFEHLTVERGLPHPTTTALAQNARGLVWIGTVGGLGGGIWRAALERWMATGDLRTLHRTFERAAIADATALFVTGDPLGIDVPLAFTTAIQVEARNLRLLGEAAVRGIPPEVVRAELIWPDGPA